MAETFYSWIGSLACYYLVYSIVMNIIPKKEYQVYVKSFMGMLLVVIMLTPVMEFIRSDYDISEIFQTEEMKRAWKEIQDQEGSGLKLESDEYFLYACQEETAAQIRSLAEEMKAGVDELSVKLKQEGEKGIRVKTIELKLAKGTPERLREELIGKLAQLYEISEGDVHVYISNS